jgi:hypothetical protein
MAQIEGVCKRKAETDVETDEDIARKRMLVEDALTSEQFVELKLLPQPDPSWTPCTDGYCVHFCVVCRGPLPNVEWHGNCGKFDADYQAELWFSCEGSPDHQGFWTCRECFRKPGQEHQFDDPGTDMQLCRECFDTKGEWCDSDADGESEYDDSDDCSGEDRGEE